MKESALSQTSRQPLSMVSECPRSGTPTISVSARFLRSCLNDDLATACGTV